MSTLPAPPAPINDYVVWANFTVTGTNDQTPPITVSVPSNTQFTIENDDPIPYDQLTEEIVLGWIQAQPGVVPTMQQIIDDQIATLENPPVNPEPTPLPWSEPT